MLIWFYRWSAESTCTTHRVDRMLSLFSSRPNWVSPTPSSVGERALLWFRGGVHTVVCERGGGRSQFRGRDKQCGTLWIYVVMYFVVPFWLCLNESIATFPPFGLIEGHKWFSRFPANESFRRTGLHLSLSAKSSFYLSAFEISHSWRTASVIQFRDDCHEQLISNGGRFKPAFAERDKKQTMIDLRGISTTLHKTF
jgi:hypothetical protein